MSLTLLKGKFSGKCSDLRRPKVCGEAHKMRGYTYYMIGPNSFKSEETTMGWPRSKDRRLSYPLNVVRKKAPLESSRYMGGCPRYITGRRQKVMEDFGGRRSGRL
jgi:hypothetical protein